MSKESHVKFLSDIAEYFDHKASDSNEDITIQSMSNNARVTREIIATIKKTKDYGQ